MGQDYPLTTNHYGTKTMITTKRTNMKKDELRSKILDAAIVIAETQGFLAIRRDGVAIKAGVSMGQINHAFGTLCQLKRSLMRAAVQREVLSVIAFGIVTGDKEALKASDELKQKAMIDYARKIKEFA